MWEKKKMNIVNWFDNCRWLDHWVFGFVGEVVGERVDVKTEGRKKVGVAGCLRLLMVFWWLLNSF